MIVLFTGVTFKAHKLILAACSKHLADLFETAPLHQNLLVILDGTSASNMAALLEFMYKGEVHVSQDSLSSFLKAAECLQVCERRGVHFCSRSRRSPPNHYAPWKPNIPSPNNVPIKL